MDRLPENYLSIPAFPGSYGSDHRSALRPWMLVVIAIAYAANPPDVLGLLFAVTTQAEFVALGHPAAEYHAMARPAAWDGVAANFPAWKYMEDKYDRQMVAITHLFRALIRALDEEAFSQILDLDGTYFNLTSLQVITRLKAAYGTATVQDFQAVRHKLQQPYVPPASMEQHVRGHKEAHALAMQYEQPFSEADKVSFLSQSIMPCGLFREYYIIFSSTYPSLADQTFVLLAKMLTAASHQLQMTTTAAAGYVAGPTQPSGDRLEKIEQQLAMLTERLVISSVPASVPAKVATKKKKFGYCWSHGSKVVHNSADCFSPKPGHESMATLRNKMGGAA